MDGTVVDDDNDGFDRPPGARTIDLLEPRQQGDEIAAPLAAAGLDDERAGSEVESANHRHLACLAGGFDTQVGAALRPGMGEIRMGQRFRFVLEQEHDVTGLRRDCQEFCVRTVVFRPGENDPRTEWRTEPWPCTIRAAAFSTPLRPGSTPGTRASGHF